MGRSLLLEAILEEKVVELFSLQKVQVGLILGQQSDPKDFGTHLVRCPDPVDDEAEVETANQETHLEDQNNDKQSDKKKNAQQQSGKGNDVFDVKWIAEHGRQVNRMLIGGTSVIGLFVYCSSDIVAKNQTKLVQCLQGLQSRIECNKWLRKAYIHSDRYLLHICSTTKKLTCRTFDLSDKQGASKPADCRYQQFLFGWHCASSTIDVHINISVPLSQKATETEKSILLACQDEIEQIWNSHTTEGCQLIDEDQSISGQPSKSKKQAPVGKELKFTLFKNLSHKGVDNIMKKEATNLEVKFFGAIQSKAVLNAKATYGDAIKALKVDIIRSLLTRIGLLCEEAEVNNLDQVQEWSLVSPTRVFYPVALSKLYFCDYSFKDESVEDILSRFSELLNLNSKSSELVYLEKSPDISEASMLFHSPEKCIDQQSDIASEMSSSLVEEPSKNYFIYFLIALLVMLIGVAVHIALN